ncbi:MAG TPA: peptide-methionine (S)-S-oxide reductase MsrA [Candidatus Eisenbacteria bacterium]|nr:peptide-methionine (S)-S-oxide reductase MsrA [Candidatus Eisenbacteria bacterium]
MKRAWAAGLALALLWPAVPAAAAGEPMADKGLKKAAFAGGCFWGVEKIFQELPGVVSTQVGYAGGRTADPSYEEVCTGRTGHAEAVEIVYDPSKTAYEELLLTFWQYHDPTTRNRQGPDIGSQYRSVIFYYDEDQRKAAESDIARLSAAKVFKSPIVTEVVPAGTFYRAEDYHQKYLKKNPNGYCSHHFQSARIAEVLGRESPA